MTRRALQHPRFSRVFGAVRRFTSSRRAHIKTVRNLYTGTKMVQDGCLCCGADTFTLLAECDRYGFDLKKQICETCGLVQTYPALSPDFLNVFYRDHYRRLYTKSDEVNYASLMAEQEERGARFLTFIMDAIPNRQISDFNVVEIGCSAGGILAHFKPHVKSVSGCDLDEAAIAYARQTFALDVEVAEFPTSLPEGRKIFVLSHVLEHIPKPQALLRLIRSHMTDGDYLFIEVPGLNMVGEGAYSHNLRSYFHIAHVADYTRSTLSLILKISGFAAVQCDETVTGLFVRSDDATDDWHKDPSDSVENILRIEQTFKLWS
jgi:2-polyprenyl-3-methyl-5-hydroxy-6-metoxy-1,4-benzoquinol methylase